MVEIKKEKITLAELINMKPAIQKLVVKELPAKLSYRLAKLVRLLEPEYVSYEETRRKLVEKYGDKTEDGNITVPQDKLEVFMNELNGVLKEEVEFSYIPFSIDEIEKVELSVQDIVSIEKLLIEKE